MFGLLGNCVILKAAFQEDAPSGVVLRVSALLELNSTNDSGSVASFIGIVWLGMPSLGLWVGGEGDRSVSGTIIGTFRYRYIF